MTYRHPNGNTREQQAVADRRYRDRQRRQRAWVDELAEALGVDKDQLTATPAADLVHRILSDASDPP